MRKNFGKKTWLYPMPVLIIATYDKNGEVDVMNAAWGGIYDTNQIMICLDHSHKTTDNVKDVQAFSVSIGDKYNVDKCDYVGIISLKKDKDKIKKSGFTFEKSEFVNAPIIKELKMTLECKLNKFNEDGIVVGDIVNIEIIPKDFGRIAAQTAKQVVLQKVREAERNIIFTEYNDRKGEIVSGIVQKNEKGTVILDLGKLEGIMPLKDQIPTETYNVNDKVKAYVVSVEKGWSFF